jgi:hypothetical protein
MTAHALKFTTTCEPEIGLLARSRTTTSKQQDESDENFAAGGQVEFAALGTEASAGRAWNSPVPVNVSTARQKAEGILMAASEKERESRT